MTPQCIVKIDGQAASGELVSRLISCEVTDKEGIESDTCRLELNNSPAVAIPRRGAKIQIWMGYDRAPTYMGGFTVDETTLTLFPHKMSISGKAADFREDMKGNKERHWDDVTLQEIIADIANDNGLTPKVDGEIGAHKYAWFGQQDESDLHVLRRLEQRHGALFSIKDGLLIFAKRGAGNTAGGDALSGFVVTPQNIVQGSGKISFSDRAEYKEVVAYHQDRDEAERVEVSAPSSDEAKAVFRIGEPFTSVDEAQTAANSKAEELKRQAMKFSCSVVGDPAARAGAPLRFAAMKVGIDGMEFIIETARHSWSKSGYTTTIDGLMKV